MYIKKKSLWNTMNKIIILYFLNIAVLRQKQATQWVRLHPALAVCIQ